MPKVTVYDKSGQPYTVSQAEAQTMMDSGAYFESSKGAVRMPSTKSPLITIYDVKTGKPLQRRPVDARELVKSGHYAFTMTKKRNVPEQTQILSESAPNAPIRQGNASLPILTEETSKEEIMAVLGQYGVQYRANMGKPDLLNLWHSYISGQA